MQPKRTIGRPPKTADERFWAKVDKNGPIPAHVPELGNCWVWTGGKNPGGYGYFSLTTPVLQHIYAHRYAFGPTELRVLHRCDNPPCVRKSHLFEGTLADNSRDRDTKGRNANIAKTHCKNGHPLGEPRTYPSGRRERSCRICSNAVSNASHKRLREQRRATSTPVCV